MMNSQRLFLLILSISLLAGCAIASKTHVPTGEEGYSISCSGALSSWGNCLEKAGELCGNRGYEVISKSGDAGDIFFADKNTFFGGTRITRSMLIKCKSGIASGAEYEKPRADHQEKRGGGLGTGWVVARGYAVTNHHVVEGSNRVFLIAGNNVMVEARVVARDTANDLAVLSYDAARMNEPPIPIARSQAELGTKVFTVGYPHPDIMGTAPKITDGIVSSTTGISDDPRTYQVSVPLQAGNSGGPLLNMNGEVIGITTSKLNAAKVFQWTGDLPENVNYAVKVQYLEPLIEPFSKAIGSKGTHLKGERTLEELSRKLSRSVFIERWPGKTGQ